MNNKIEHIIQYFKKIKEANKELTKKEAFKDLLNRLYPDDNEIRQIIDKITLGAETTIVNIPRRNKLHRGSADTLYNNIIIEFENNLKQQYNHAKEQLSGYLLGQFKSGAGYNFTLIASDFINWKVLAPDVSCLDKLETLNEDELILNEVKSASFSLNENNAEDFYYWIDRFLFKEEKQKATLKSIEESFGYQSYVFIESFRELNKWFNEAKKYNTVQVSFEQWSKFLSVAYGSFDAKEDIFIIHTYLSIFSKMLAYSVLSGDDYIDDNEMKKILNGSIFYSYNIANFVENDFFHWVVEDRNFKNLKKVFRLIAQEISSFDFTNVEEDILKGVYQELIDIDTRHSLGEYYTPDWLCERIVNEFKFNREDKILDPACGSGSFLRAAIHNLKQNNPNITAEDINQQIYGIDIHPLSVQIAKTTLLLTLGKDITKAKRPIHLNIILANTLLAPEGVKNLFGKEFKLYIDDEQYIINTQILENVDVYNSVLDICEELAEQTMFKKALEVDVFWNTIERQLKSKGLTEQIIDSYYKLYIGFKKVKEKNRDSIWKFILSNLYKPYFLSGKFDYIIGNPPWFTFSSIKNENYQNVLDELAKEYGVKPSKTANYPHLEIAAIFLAYCSNYFLKNSGKLAFVLPRSFFNADHHDNTRNGTAKGFAITKIWDLEDVSPLFNIPSCVIFTEKTQSERKIKATGLPGIKLSGKLPFHNCHYSIARNYLDETEVKWYLIKLGKSTAFSTSKSRIQSIINPYKKLFKQGATIVPRVFYFVELNQEEPEDFEDRIINIKTSESIKDYSKLPWKGLEFSGLIESRFLFRTALSRSILPFVLYKPELIVLPITIEINNYGQKEIILHTSDKLRDLGYIHAAKWFVNCERIWDIHRTQKNQKINAENYLNWKNKLTIQNLNAKYLVLYNSSAKDANALVIKREALEQEFIVESVSYVFYTNNINEANYLSSILNSTLPNKLIKEFQSKGSFGARHVHKKVLDVYFPSYDDTEALHRNLSEIGKICHEKAVLYVATHMPSGELTATRLGRFRVEIKKHLSRELKEIDRIVRKLIGMK